MTAHAGDTIESRERARAEARRARRTLAPAERRERAERAARAAMRLVARRRARRVALYIGHASEMPTLPLRRALLARGIAVYLPVIGCDGAMHFRRWRGGPVRRGAHGIPRPVGGARSARSALDIVFLPLLAFDTSGTRLGAGGGYYDRWLAGVRGRRPLLCGYAFAAQEAQRLPRAEWDIPISAVVTERGIRRLPE